MTEEWRTIEGAPDYQVSSLGNVRRSVVGRRGAPIGPIKPWVDKIGRPTVRLCVVGGKISRKVSRLVCAAFNGPPPFPRAIVAHWDDVPANNDYRNLRWTDRQGNKDDMRRLGTLPLGEQATGAKLTEANVVAIRASSGSCASVAVCYGVSPETIRRVRNRIDWGHVQ